MNSGIAVKCYNSKSGQNIFAHIERPIKFNAIGNHCRSPYCVNSSHFLSLGVIPEMTTPSYADLRDRAQANWYTPEMKEFLNGKLVDNNLQYGKAKRITTNTAEFFGNIYQTSILKMKRCIKKMVIRGKGNV